MKKGKAAANTEAIHASVSGFTVRQCRSDAVMVKGCEECGVAGEHLDGRSAQSTLLTTFCKQAKWSQ
jgi:hypothetical protein